MKLGEGGQNQTEVNIQRGIFQRDSFSPLLFATAMIPLDHIFRKRTSCYQFSKPKEKINNPMYVDDIKIFAKNGKELENLIQTIRIYSQDIGTEFGIEKCAMLIIKRGKRETTKASKVGDRSRE